MSPGCPPRPPWNTRKRPPGVRAPPPGQERGTRGRAFSGPLTHRHRARSPMGGSVPSQLVPTWPRHGRAQNAKAAASHRRGPGSDGHPAGPRDIRAAAPPTGSLPPPGPCRPGAPCVQTPKIKPLGGRDRGQTGPCTQAARTLQAGGDGWWPHGPGEGADSGARPCPRPSVAPGWSRT